ncbi:Ig-like domain-containing protein [Capnocytophaga sp.]|uniref:Ig-like domain-containing protein n=1 Tax=Capnocytophaga sp. TaxID=44737 RepID=UPI0026DAEB04|nr:Ig-like domain-containing protein [Capnocytophaga sp.]MDO5105672.1 Ig-like domain-containing protein [Capnocytophaga sp.]
MRKNAIWALCALLLAVVACSTKEKDAPIVIEKISIIELSEKSPVTMLEGESKEVTVSGQYVEKIEVTTSDSNIVTVSTKDKVFTINAKAAGTATVTVTSGKATKALSVSVNPKNQEEELPVIELSEKSPVTMLEGENKQVTVSGEKVTKFEVTSSDTNIVTVSTQDNVFTINAKAAGTATVTVTSGKATKALGVAVSPKNVLVNRIEFGSQVKYPIGKGAKLEYTIHPENATNKQLTWTSDNPSVVRVDNDGNIHVSNVANGKATITAKATDGSEVSAQVTIWAVNPVQSIQIIFGDSFKTEVGHKGKLNADVTGANPQFGASDNTLSWRSSNPSVVKIDKSGNYEVLQEGEATITATANDGFGAESSINIKAIKLVTKLKINNLDNNGELSIKKNTSLQLEVTTFNGDKLVETIRNGKSQSPYVTIRFSLRDEKPSNLAEVRDGVLKATRTGTFTLRASYSNSLENENPTECSIKVTVTD